MFLHKHPILFSPSFLAVAKANAQRSSCSTMKSRSRAWGPARDKSVHSGHVCYNFFFHYPWVLFCCIPFSISFICEIWRIFYLLYIGYALGAFIVYTWNHWMGFLFKLWTNNLYYNKYNVSIMALKMVCVSQTGDADNFDITWFHFIEKYYLALPLVRLGTYYMQAKWPPGGDTQVSPHPYPHGAFRKDALMVYLVN